MGSMTADVFHSFVDRSRNLVAGVALTTETCKTAQDLHHFAATSCIAMGRLMTAAALTGLVERRGPVSLQVLSDGHLGKLFADVTPEGHLRGYLDNPTIALSRPGGQLPGRRSIASAVGRGILSVIRLGDGTEFAQSAVDLASGEIDGDVEAFLESSDQVPTALVCEVLLDDAAIVTRAGGVLIQGMPGVEASLVAALKIDLRERLAGLLGRETVDAITIARQVLPGAMAAEAPVPLAWHCRCSYDRAVAGLMMLPPDDLAEMVDTREQAEVRCDFCSYTYFIPPADVEKAFLTTITAHG